MGGNGPRPVQPDTDGPGTCHRFPRQPAHQQRSRQPRRGDPGRLQGEALRPGGGPHV
jgi:hypothetical protein